MVHGLVIGQRADDGHPARRAQLWSVVEHKVLFLEKAGPTFTTDKLSNVVVPLQDVEEREEKK